MNQYILTAPKDPKTFVKLLGEQPDENDAINKADLKSNRKAQAKIIKVRANSLRLLAEEAITKQDWLDLEAGNSADLVPLKAEEQQLIEDQKEDPIELQGYEQMLKDQAARLAEGGSEQDFKSNFDYGFYVEAMELRIEVSPKAEHVSASAIGVVNALLPIATDKNTAPASGRYHQNLIPHSPRF